MRISALYIYLDLVLEHPCALAGGEAPEARGAVPAAGHRVVPVDGHGPHLARGTRHVSSYVLTFHHNIHYRTFSVCPVRVCSREATLSPPSLVIDIVDTVDTIDFVDTICI